MRALASSRLKCVGNHAPRVPLVMGSVNRNTTITRQGGATQPGVLTQPSPVFSREGENGTEIRPVGGRVPGLRFQVVPSGSYFSTVVY